MNDFHDAANLFPLDEENLRSLADDIVANGQKETIKILDGKILDGRRRFLACELAGINPVCEEIEVADPIAYSQSLNIHRRHLTASQRSVAAGKAKELYAKQAKERMSEGGKAGGKGRQKQGVVIVPPPNEEAGKARDKAGKAFGVSGKMVDLASKVLNDGVPELVKAVEEGQLSVSSAAEVADEPEEIQKEFAEKAKVSGGRFRKPKIEPAPEPDTAEKPTGVGIRIANEAINCLIRIPKNDPFRKRGFQIVKDFIKANQ